jgi:carbonic anhydrase
LNTYPQNAKKIEKKTNVGERCARESPYAEDPAIVFDAEPGDMFVMRNVANMCPKYAAPDDGHHGGASNTFL